MNVGVQLLRQIDEPGLSRNGQVMLRCQLAKELEEAGNYEAACGALGDRWQGIGLRPLLTELNDEAQALVLLRAGTLTGWLGSAQQISGAQESAKNLISESITLFESIGLAERAIESQVELAWCYWREGAFEEAHTILKEALHRLPEAACELRAVAQVRLAEVERAAGRFSDALRILLENALLVETCQNDLLKGRFHSTLAMVLDILGVAERRQDYIDRALIEFTAASYHFELGGHTRYCARVENNLGFLCYRIQRFAEAHQHLARARSLFKSLKEEGSVAQVDDTRARAMVDEGRYTEAERIIRSAVHALEKGDEQASLSEAITTHAVVLARLNRPAPARAAFERAMQISEQVGHTEGIGYAALSLIEELAETLKADQRQFYYLRADQALAYTQRADMLERLRNCARRLIEASRSKETDALNASSFVHASEKSAQMLQAARSLAVSDRTILISGETGTGKEVLAHLVHEWSGRRGRFIAINCAALSDTLIESQLFGHRKGSFTDAAEDYAGAVREAEGGTLLLDEIGELSLSNQAKLLRLIEHGELSALGSSGPEHVDVRIIAATNHNLHLQVARKLFRTDLFYRLASFQIEILPLRERSEDIPVLARHFIKEVSTRHQKRVIFTPDSVNAMSQLPLNGNARELRALIERTYLTAADKAVIEREAVETIALRQTHKAGFAEAWSGCSLDTEVRSYEERLIRLALQRANGSVTQAARLLNVTHQGLAYILNGRHKHLLNVRKPARVRRTRLMGVKQESTAKNL